jgi:hypothetical protein
VPSRHSAGAEQVGRSPCRRPHHLQQVPIADFVPLEVRSVTKDNKYGVICSAWGEGLRTQDLECGRVGEVRPACRRWPSAGRPLTCNLVQGPVTASKKSAALTRRSAELVRHELPERPRRPSPWRTRAICEVHLPVRLGRSIRKLLKKGGVDNASTTSAAYSALYRPGPMGMKNARARTASRKRGPGEVQPPPPDAADPGGHLWGHGLPRTNHEDTQRGGATSPSSTARRSERPSPRRRSPNSAKYKEMFLKNGQVKNLGCIRGIRPKPMGVR